MSIKRKIIKYFEIIAIAPLNKTSFIIIWCIWMVFIEVAFDKLETGHFIAVGDCTTGFMFLGIILTMHIFSNKQYVEEIVKKYYKNLMKPLYTLNILLIFSEEILDAFVAVCLFPRAGIDAEYIMLQTVFLVFWLLSIPLVLIYNQLDWLINVLIIIIISGLCYIFFNWFIYCCSVTIISVCILAIGIIVCAVAVSLKLSMKRLKQYKM